MTRSKSKGRNSWADQYEQLPSQSAFHEKVREIFRTGWFKSLQCFQEVPVKDLIPNYYSGQHRYDWWIKELGTVVELHGQQHYSATSFGSASYEQKQTAFAQSQRRDSDKKEAAMEAGFKYIEVSYKDISKLNVEWLKELILGGQ